MGGNDEGFGGGAELPGVAAPHQRLGLGKIEHIKCHR